MEFNGWGMPNSGEPMGNLPDLNLLGDDFLFDIDDKTLQVSRLQRIREAQR
jgi:hypothetical protein